MPNSSPEAGTPQTPPRNINGRRDGHTTPTRSPPVSPSLSLYSLGMSPLSPLSPLRRQFSSPLFRSSSSPWPNANDDFQDRTQDSKDVLIQRLNDLTARIIDYDEAQENSLDSLHAKVDEMENVLGRKLGARSQKSRRRQSALNPDDHDPFSGPSSPSDVRMANTSRHMSKTADEPEKRHKETMEAMQPRKEPNSAVPDMHMQHILAEAQKLNESLAAVVASLKARQEEEDHIQELLITRAERAAQRIIYLEERVSTLENELNDGEMDILNLQIQLKAIEVQCLSYVPKDADPDLLDSIQTWKADWSALKRKRARIKDDQVPFRTPTSRTSRTPVARSHTTSG